MLFTELARAFGGLCMLRVDQLKILLFEYREWEFKILSVGILGVSKWLLLAVFPYKKFTYYMRDSAIH